MAADDLRDGERGEDSVLFWKRRTESARERAVFRYLHPWTEVNRPAFLHRSAFPHKDEPSRQPAACPDTALTSFAQLGAWRLNARRSFVTLLSTSVEYVLAEAARSTSLQYDVVEDSKDAPWIGTCSFPRNEGLHDLAINSWRKASKLRELPGYDDTYYVEGLSPHWYIVSDVRRQPECMQRAFANRAPWMRFFCAIPIRDTQGNVVGSYTVADDKPRYGISAQEMTFLEDMADTVTEHLQSTLLRSQCQRSERLIQGLYLFNDGKDSLRHWWLRQENIRMQRTGRHVLDHRTLQDDDERLADEFGTQEMSDGSRSSTRLARGGTSPQKPSTATTARSNSAAADDRATEHVASQDFDVRPERSHSSQPAFVGEGATDSGGGSQLVGERFNIAKPPEETTKPRRTSAKPFDLIEASKHAYARASNLIREAINAEGVVFVEANMPSGHRTGKRGPGPRATSTNGYGVDSSSTSSASNEHGTARKETSETSDTDDQRGKEACKLHGFSTRSKSTIAGSHSWQHRFELSQSHLAQLVKNYPRGKVFNFHENGELYSSSSEDNTSGSSEDTDITKAASTRAASARQTRDARHLGRVMVGARTIAFYPLWDNAVERWRSCLFVWSTTPLRFFDPVEDITYLAAFGHSLIAELARLETVASDKAKGTFISSVSHELRSPLHGILGGVEFLLSGDLSPFQAEMATTISMAGRTLLDTVNHILDYSKIASFTRTQRKARAAADNSRQQSGLLGNEDEVGVTHSVDLADLTEQAVETVIAAHIFEGAARSTKPTMTSNKKSRLGSILPAYSKPRSIGPVSVVLDFAYRKNWTVEISPGSWLRIITNLVGNALKYTHEGTIMIKLSFANATDDDGTERADVTLTVEDTGIGMSADFLANGFYTPFQQADSLSTGTGLGLSIVKQIARDLRADMDVQSTSGKGTTITVKLPLRFTANPQQEATEQTFEQGVNGLNLQHFYVHTPADDLVHCAGPDATNVAAMYASVRKMASDWLHCEPRSGAHTTTATLHRAVYTITEFDLSTLSKTRPELLSAMLSELAERQIELIVLGCSVQRSTEIALPGYSSTEAIYVHQPIGPRKLLRSIAAAKGVSTNVVVSEPAQNGLQVDTRDSFNAVQHLHTKDKHIATDNGFPWSSTPSSTGFYTSPRVENGRLERPARPKSRRTVTPSQLGRSGSSSSSRSTSEWSPAVLTSPLTPGILFPVENANNSMEPNEPRVLLVEDNQVNLKLLSALMNKLKLPYECATNGREALDAYKANPPGFFLILMDISMPVMDGCTSTARIRELEKKLHLPRCFIVALTGVSNGAAREQAFSSGVDDYYTKPIRMKALSELIAQVQGPA